MHGKLWPAVLSYNDDLHGIWLWMFLHFCACSLSSAVHSHDWQKGWHGRCSNGQLLDILAHLSLDDATRFENLSLRAFVFQFVWVLKCYGVVRNSYIHRSMQKLGY